MKRLMVLIALVKYPSNDYFYLTANSYLVESNNADALENAAMDFRSHVETDGFKITHFMVYVVPQGQIADANR
jgi:hypothetical protein